ERMATLCDGVAPLVLGQDVSDPERVCQELRRRLLPIGRQWGAPGPIWQAISAVDQALWDLKGKRAGQSVAQLLGGGPPRRSVPAYASGVGPTDVITLCESALDAGLTAVKTKVGFGVDTDHTTLGDARSALGAEVALFADANQAWSLDEAQAMSELLERHQVGWIEEPLAGDDLGELERLSATIPIPIATGENVYGESEFERYLNSKAVHTIQPDVAKSGGLTLAAAVARSADRAGASVAPHCYSGAVSLAASLQFAAAFPVVTWVELDVRRNPLRSDLLTVPLRLEAGALVLPEGPGLGVEIDQAVADRAQIHREQRTQRDL
ncbi:MAG: mandelate racemase/muconate lactonizing enzyme family protein, partial [Micromonosporaceae bacterium]